MTYLSDKDLATRYSIHRATIWRWAEKGIFPKPIKLNNSTRWRLADVERWEELREGEK